MLSEQSLENKKFKHVCEVCGLEEMLTAEEAYNAGWDYPPFMGEFGVVSPRTCPICPMMATAWAALTLQQKTPDQLSDNQKKAVKRIIAEPFTILTDDV